MAWLVIGFLIGVILIVKGGDFFLDAAVWMAEVSGIPKFVIGATIVSIATTLPELFVSSIAAAQGKVDMAIGNAVGSVTVNTGLIMAIGILFMPIIVKRKDFMPKGIILILSVASLLILSFSGKLTVVKSIVLFLLFGCFIYENLQSSRRAELHALERKMITKREVIINILKFIFGTAGIVIGSNLLVNNGSDLALHIGIPENVIGLTAIAIGTSLPELVTAITAIIKKESSISVGNIIGANIIDTSLILPVCAVISKGSIPVEEQAICLDIPICLLIACIAVIPAIIKERFYKWQGIACIGIYIGYISYIFAVAK